MNSLTRLVGWILLSLASASTATALEYEYSLIQNGENVGYLKVERDGSIENVRYFVDNNGRGPKHSEQIVLDKYGIPLRWTVNGTSLMGGEVNEKYDLVDGIGRWQSQADRGEISISGPTLYAVNDSSPWADYVYARALLSNDVQSMSILPSGEISIEKVSEVVLDVQDEQVPLTIYRLSGVELNPALIALDSNGVLFTDFLLIREGYEELLPELREISAEIAAERTKNLAAKLRHTFAAPYAVANVRILDPIAGKISAPSIIWIEGERIQRIEKLDSAEAFSDCTLVFDGEGGTVMPGMWDVHSHSTSGSGLYYIAAGVTSTRDMGNDNDVLPTLIEQIESGTAIGPRIIPAGFIEGRSPYSARYGIVVENEESALEAVKYYADREFPFIKIYNSMNPSWMPAVAERARSYGMRTIGHIPAFTNADEMIDVGYDEITHINQLMLGWLLEEGEDTRTLLRLTGMTRGAQLDLNDEKVTDTVLLMQKHKVAIDPTAGILERLMLSRAGIVPKSDAAYLENMPIGYQRDRKRSFVTIENASVDNEYRQGFQRVLDTIKLLSEAGIRILPGTDDGTGFSVHRELELYQEAGIPTGEVLRIATSGPAGYFGYQADLGTIEAGKLADFVLVDGNPLEELASIRKGRMVVKNGDVYFPSEIYRELSIVPFTERPKSMSASGEHPQK